MTDTADTPPTMKAAIATGFGEIDDNIFLRQDWPRPELDTTSKGNGFMIIRVLACALAPGDLRVLSGKTDYVQLPPGGHPYIVGSDVCGVVEQVQDDEPKFKVGDRVVSRFDEPIPVGGLAEYRIVKTSLSEIAPTTVTPVEACGLPASAMAAKVLATKYVEEGNRVLVLGGSGGVGTSLCQYVKLKGASFLAATSTATELVKSLGADRVINYKEENWWEIPEFQEQKFDLVFDLVNGDNWTRGGKSGLAVKRSGKYVALVPGVETEIVVQGKLDVLRIMYQFFGLHFGSRLNPFVPSWHAPEGLELKPGCLAGLFKDVDEGRLRIVIDDSCPFQFTEDGVRRALALQKSIHAHGKVVVKIADE